MCEYCRNKSGLTYSHGGCITCGAPMESTTSYPFRSPYFDNSVFRTMGGLSARSTEDGWMLAELAKEQERQKRHGRS